ncbi:uncharacterized protein HD556DRAFT_1302319 [Suillus plorans]|uniref:Uncharacterized protein n=1 Tax=Suillus plorans TaxID=116603 RepID=A0A9P7E395_9AGAM|nr:uncharacterized protein HD556DRAFT_1302319 [Suillus plorans]KAG1809904.1 hypothetical protein HD556DRAFT_1302319 [Suillus plorans]
MTAKGNSAIRACILKTIKDAIGSSEVAKDPCVIFSEKNLCYLCLFFGLLEDDEDCKIEEEIIKGGTKDRFTPDAVTVKMVMSPKVKKPMTEVRERLLELMYLFLKLGDFASKGQKHFTRVTKDNWK